MQQKVKSFVSNHHAVLDKEVNEWLLSENCHVEQMIYQMSFDPENDEMYYSVLIFYWNH